MKKTTKLNQNFIRFWCWKQNQQNQTVNLLPEYFYAIKFVTGQNISFFEIHYRILFWFWQLLTLNLSYKPQHSKIFSSFCFSMNFLYLKILTFKMNTMSQLVSVLWINTTVLITFTKYLGYLCFIKSVTKYTKTYLLYFS